MLCSVWRAAKVSTRCLHRLTNSAMPNASMSRLDLKLRSRSTLTSTHRPWQSNPFWYRWSSPEHRVEPLVEVLVGPAPGVVDAHRVVGGDGPVEEAPAGVARVLGAQARERPALRPLAEQGVLLGDEVWSGGDGSEHRASVDRRCGPGRPRRGTSLSAPPAAACPAGARGPPPSRETAAGVAFRAMSTPQRAPRSRSAFAAAFLSLLFPGLGHAYAGAYARALGFAAAPLLLLALTLGIVLRTDRAELAGHGRRLRRPDRHLHRQPRSPSSTGSSRRSTPGRSRASSTRSDASRQRAAGPRPHARQPAVDRRAARGRAGHGRGPRRRRPLRRARAQPRQLRVHRGRQRRLRGSAADSPEPGRHRSSGDSPSADASNGETASPRASCPRPTRPRRARSPPPSRPGTARSASTSWSSAWTRVRATASFNTDTLIVVSIDPVTKQVAMFQVPTRHGGRAGPGQCSRRCGAPPTAARSTAGPPRTGTARTCGRARHAERPWRSTPSRRSWASCTVSTSATTSRSTSRASGTWSTPSAASRSTSRCRSTRASIPAGGGDLTARSTSRPVRST